MEIYIIEHAPIGDFVRSYSGMSRETVLALVKEIGNPCEEVDEATYNAKVAAIPVKAILEPK